MLTYVAAVSLAGVAFQFLTPAGFFSVLTTQVLFSRVPLSSSTTTVLATVALTGSEGILVRISGDTDFFILRLVDGKPSISFDLGGGPTILEV
jgi:hypothetical protein